MRTYCRGEGDSCPGTEGPPSAVHCVKRTDRRCLPEKGGTHAGTHSPFGRDFLPAWRPGSGPRWKTRTPARALGAAIDVILPVACGILRVVAVIVAIVIIVRCLMSLFREKPGKEIWGWLTLGDGTRLDLCHWENAIGRGRWADVSLDFPTVSRSHAALLRDDKGSWKLQPLQTKNGTRLNGKKVTHTVPGEDRGRH